MTSSFRVLEHSLDPAGWSPPQWIHLVVLDEHCFSSWPVCAHFLHKAWSFWHCFGVWLVLGTSWSKIKSVDYRIRYFSRNVDTVGHCFLVKGDDIGRRATLGFYEICFLYISDVVFALYVLLEQGNIFDTHWKSLRQKKLRPLKEVNFEIIQIRKSALSNVVCYQSG